MDNIVSYIGKQIKKYRKERNWTQTDLGNKVNKRASTISDYEKGKSEPPQDTLSALADVFDISIRDFFPDQPSVDYPAAKFNQEDQQFLSNLENFLAQLDDAERKHLLANIELAVELFKKQK